MVKMVSTLDPTFDRSTGIGASEVAALLGLDPRKTPLSLWLDKTGNAPPFEGNRFTEMGQRCEPVIADAYAEREGVELETCGTTRHPDLPHVFATPDRRVVGTKPDDRGNAGVVLPPAGSRFRRHRRRRRR